jgi:hypothetical protein
MNWFRWGNGLAGACGMAWAYVAFQYNWLNVGGGASRFKAFWIIASGVVPCITLGIWLAALVLIAIMDWRRSLAPANRVARLAATLLITPVALFTADWLFHLGFPAAPV